MSEPDFSDDVRRLNPELEQLFGSGKTGKKSRKRSRSSASGSGSRRPTEAQIQRQIIDLLLTLGWTVIRVNGGAMRGEGGRFVRFIFWRSPGMPDWENGGVSDLIALGDGRTLYIEVKRPGGKQRPNQKKFEKAVRAARLTYIVVESVGELLSFLDHN